MKLAPTPEQVRRALQVSRRLEVGAIYSLPTGRFARFDAVQLDALCFTVVDVHRVRVLTGEPVTLSAPHAQHCRLAWHAWQWACRQPAEADEDERRADRTGAWGGIGAPLRRAA